MGSPAQMDLSFSRSQASDYQAERALIIRNPWADQILDGTKKWEIRGSATGVRGEIGIIRARSKHVFGYCELVRVHGPLSLDEMKSTVALHGISKEELDSSGLPYPSTYAWELVNPRRLDTPQPYHHPSGAIIWVRLRPEREDGPAFFGSSAQEEPAEAAVS